MGIYKKDVISEDDICESIKESNPGLPDSTLKWKLYQYLKENSLSKVGVKKFIKDARKYNYDYQSPLTILIDKFLSINYPNLKIVVWEKK